MLTYVHCKKKNIDLLLLITEFEIPPGVICVTETRLKFSPSLKIDLPNSILLMKKPKQMLVAQEFMKKMIGTLPLIAIFILTVCFAKTFELTCFQVIMANML